MTWATAAIGSVPFRVDISIGGHALVADETAMGGGADEGPTPYDFLLAGLGACTAIGLKKFAEDRRWPLEGLDVDLRFINRSGALGIERILSIVGDLDQAQRDQLLDAANQTPMTTLLSRGFRIHTEWA